MRARFILAAVIAAAAVSVFASFDASYQSRRGLVATQRAGCYRGQQDRHANAEAWYTASLARAESAKHDKAGSAQQRIDARAARVYLATARSLNSRTSRQHSIRSLGPGHLNCRDAFPAASFF